MYEFSRLYRLASKHDFQSVFAKPNKKAHNKYLLALYKPNQKPHARLGIIIAKHHLKLAVHRNRLRRVIRESFRQHKEALKGLDIIVLLRSECIPLDSSELRKDIDCLWQKLTLS
jgi:ribonuclease P protein component